MEDYEATVRSARTILPVAVEMEKLFPVADHFITHYAFDDKPKLWNTEVHFGGRYDLGMQVLVEIDYGKNWIVRIIDEPQFVLVATEKVTILPDGRAQTSYDGALQRTFGLDKWQTFYRANGDLTVLEIPTTPNKVENFDEAVRQTRRDRLAISLLDE